LDNIRPYYYDGWKEITTMEKERNWLEFQIERTPTGLSINITEAKRTKLSGYLRKTLFDRILKEDEEKELLFYIQKESK